MERDSELPEIGLQLLVSVIEAELCFVSYTPEEIIADMYLMNVFNL